MTATEPVKTEATPFRFYDNRQKYLAFVNTCNEKSVIATRAAQELSRLQPRPPALRIFDAGMGDATVLSRLIRTVHRYFPTVPLVAVAKEISLEDVRLGLEKMPDRFYEHPHTVLVDHEHDVRRRAASDAERPGAGRGAELAGDPSDRHVGLRLRRADRGARPGAVARLADEAEPEDGQPDLRAPVGPRRLPGRPRVPARRRDPAAGANSTDSYDFVLASQPWRARTAAEFKAQKILAPLARSLAPGGSPADDPVVRTRPRARDRAAALARRDSPSRSIGTSCSRRFGRSSARRRATSTSTAPSDEEALFRYQMHTLPSEIGDRIGTSTLFAAWNAAIYVNQIEDERLDPVVHDGSYIDATQAVLQKHGGLWFNDEAFVVRRLRPRAEQSPY